jgi:hypothetical protein
VNEELKKRNRLIINPDQLNETLRPLYSGAEINLPTPWDIQDSVHFGTLGAAFDLTKSFYQNRLPEALRPYFGFLDSAGNAYQMTVLPLGYSPAAEYQHLETSILALKAAQMTSNPAVPFAELGAHHLIDVELHTDTYIDNVKSVGPDGHVHTFAENFVWLCAHLNVTLNVEPCNIPSSLVPFCGQSLDLIAKTATLNDKNISKLVRLQQWAEDLQPSELITMNTFRSVLGLALFATRVLRVRPAYFTLLKCYRRRCSTARSVNDPVSIWPSAVADLLRWLEELLFHARFPTEVPTVDPLALWTLYTDASLHGCGAVLIGPDGCIYLFQHVWSAALAALHINILETEAVILALQHFGHLIRGDPVSLVVDNTTVLSAFEHGFSRSFDIDRCLLRVQAHIVSVQYIRSDDNPSDPLSRGRDADPISISNAVKDRRPSTGVGWKYRRGMGAPAPVLSPFRLSLSTRSNRG